jgi:hypothetical protein
MINKPLTKVQKGTFVTDKGSRADQFPGSRTYSHPLVSGDEWVETIRIN